MTIKKQDYEAWRANPVTEAFFAAISEVRDKAVNDWNSVSWNNDQMWIDGQAQYMRTACRARAECAEDILNIQFEEEADDDEPDRNHPDGIQGIGQT